MRARLPLLVTLLLLPCALPPAVAADDAGTGGDAPDSRSAAIVVAAGNVTGSVSDYDRDWYRIDVPEGKSLQVKFSSSRSSWNSLRVYEEEADALRSIYPGGTLTVRPTGGVAYLEVYGSDYAPTAYVITLTLLTPAAQDDAGSGRDAGNRYYAAIPAQGGVVRGTLDDAGGDVADWYRVEAAADEYLRIMPRSSYAYVDLRDQDGRYVGYGYGSYVAPGGVLLVGVRGAYVTRYEIDIVPVKRADLAVVDVQVTPRAVRTEAAATPAYVVRDVEITLANAGPGATSEGRLLVYTTQNGPNARRILSDTSITLAAGEGLVRAVEWSTLGQAGDVRLHVEVYSTHDRNVDDNAATVRTYNLVGGTYYGVDALTAPGL